MGWKMRSMGAFLVFLVFVVRSDAYRLNVPRVLLPRNPEKPVQFRLEVSQPHGGCFKWTSQDDTVAVVENSKSECSDFAIVRGVSRQHGESSTVVWATDERAAVKLSCAVTVDEVDRIEIVTTAKVLFIDAEPTRLAVDAYNKDGDRFSTLGSLAIDWKLTTTAGNQHALQVVPFSQASYDAPPEIVELEKAGRRGSLILVKGTSTGSATLSARILDSGFEAVKEQSLEVSVVAHLLLAPGPRLFAPRLSEIRYSVSQIRGNLVEAVAMPSDLYQLVSSNTKVGRLDTSRSLLTADDYGTTAVQLLDVRKRSSTAAVRPPRCEVEVLDAESALWTTSGPSFVIPVNRPVRFNVLLLDNHGRSMYIADNLRFVSTLPKEYFDIESASENQTHFFVRPKKLGQVTITSEFKSIVTPTGRVPVPSVVRAEQLVTIVDDLIAVPDTIIFPHLPEFRFDFPITVSGGTGSYVFSTADSNLAVVDARGFVRPGKSEGETRIDVTDAANSDIRTSVKILIIPVAGVEWGVSRLEAVQGSRLVVHPQLLGRLRDGRLVRVSDCRTVNWNLAIGNSSVFGHDRAAASSLPQEGSGCGTLTLVAKTAGDSELTLSYSSFSAGTHVFSYPPLELSESDLCLSLGSSFSVDIIGGPGTAVAGEKLVVQAGADSKKHGSRAEIVQLSAVRVFCAPTEEQLNVNVRVQHAVSSGLPLPLVLDTAITLSCTKLESLEIRPRRPDSTPACPRQCDVLWSEKPSQLAAVGLGKCGSNKQTRQLQSINAASISWKGTDTSLLTVSQDGKAKPEVALATPTGKTGTVDVVLSTSSPTLSTTRTFRLERRAAINPTKAILIVGQTSATRFTLSRGSGHFTLEKGDATSTKNRASVYAANLEKDAILMQPKNVGSSTVRILDLCFGDSAALELPVRTADLNELQIHAPKLLLEGEECEVSVEALGIDDKDGLLEGRVQVDLHSSTPNLQIERLGASRFRVKALSTGLATLSAVSAKSALGSHAPLASRPHQLEVFEALRLQPESITLMPESIFQFELFGGPQEFSGQSIHWHVNDTKLSSVRSDGEVQTTRLTGWFEVTATLAVASKQYSASAVVRVSHLSLLVNGRQCWLEFVVPSCRHGDQGQGAAPTDEFYDIKLKTSLKTIQSTRNGECWLRVEQPYLPQTLQLPLQLGQSIVGAQCSTPTTTNESALPAAGRAWADRLAALVDNNLPLLGQLTLVLLCALLALVFYRLFMPSSSTGHAGPVYNGFTANTSIADNSNLGDTTGLSLASSSASPRRSGAAGSPGPVYLYSKY